MYNLRKMWHCVMNMSLFCFMYTLYAMLTNYELYGTLIVHPPNKWGSFLESSDGRSVGWSLFLKLLPSISSQLNETCCKWSLYRCSWKTLFVIPGDVHDTFCLWYRKMFMIHFVCNTALREPLNNNSLI